MNSPKHESRRFRKVPVVILFTGVALLVGLVFLFASFSWKFLGPEYQGRRLSEWANDLSFPDESNGDDTRPTEIREKHEAAVIAIRCLGKKTLPLALKLCEVENSTLEYKLMCWCEAFNEKQNALHMNYQMPYADKKWEKGLNVFRALGSDASAAIPTLIEFLQRGDSAAANNASLAFRYIGPASVPALMTVLTNGNKNAERLAGYSLSYLGSNSIAATPILLKYLKDENRELRKMASFSLTKISNEASVIVPAFSEYLRNNADHPFSAVFSKLEDFGSNAVSAVPVLIEIIESNRQPICVRHRV